MTLHGAMLRCAALALLCCAAAHAQDAKRAEMSPVPFVMGSRYGRSPERLIAPRNDRFFMGSRYGKRSEYLPVEAETRSPLQDATRRTARTMMCEYTGVMSLYRCARPHKRARYDRRSSDDAGPGEQ